MSKGLGRSLTSVASQVAHSPTGNFGGILELLDGGWFFLDGFRGGKCVWLGVFSVCVVGMVERVSLVRGSCLYKGVWLQGMWNVVCVLERLFAFDIESELDHVLGVGQLKMASCRSFGSQVVHPICILGTWEGNGGNCPGIWKAV